MCIRDSLYPIWPELSTIDKSVSAQIESNAIYSKYLERQRLEIVSFKKDESLVIPVDIDFNDVKGLSNEARDRVSKMKPATVGQLSRMEGICLLYTSPSPRDRTRSRMPSSA